MWLQKLDVDEELDRLDSHIVEIRRVLGQREPVGRRLDFLLQEFNREANTLGSKSVDARTSNAAVELKVLIDQIREQIQTYILEGRTLLGQIRDAQRELPAKPADEWALRAETYLRDRFGERYVARFRKEANDLYGDAPIPGPRMGYWRAVRNRVVALELIASELTEPPDVSAPAPPVASTTPPAPAPAMPTSK